METVLYTFQFNWADSLLWPIPIIISFVFVFAAIGVRKNRQPSMATKVVGVIIPVMALFLVLITVVWIGLPIASHFVVKSQIAKGSYGEVTGIVENFSPMPRTGHESETFEISGVHFSYSDFEIIPGYHNTASWGGVITHDGQHLKIRYIDWGEGNIIIYIAAITE